MTPQLPRFAKFGWLCNAQQCPLDPLDPLDKHGDNQHILSALLVDLMQHINWKMANAARFDCHFGVLA